jgi:hypothetical protein
MKVASILTDMGLLGVYNKLIPVFNDGLPKECHIRYRDLNIQVKFIVET